MRAREGGLIKSKVSTHFSPPLLFASATQSFFFPASLIAHKSTGQACTQTNTHLATQASSYTSTYITQKFQHKKTDRTTAKMTTLPASQPFLIKMGSTADLDTHGRLCKVRVVSPEERAMCE